MKSKSELRAIIQKIKGAVTDRERLEKLLEKRITSAMKPQLDKLMGLLGDPPSIGNVPESFWNEGNKELRRAVSTVFETIYVAQAIQLSEQIQIGVDWSLVNRRAVEWASIHSGQLINDLTNTTRNILTDYVSKYYTDGWTLDELTERLAPIFGNQRARTIAITETTNAATQSELAMVNFFESEYGVKFSGVWYTANDDRVCDICGPRHGLVITDGDYPPAHVNCRCEVAWEMKPRD